MLWPQPLQPLFPQGMPAQSKSKPGDKDEIIKKAKQLQKEIGGHLYGLEEHGGTSTIYVSKVPFEKINKAIVQKTRASPWKVFG